MAIARVSSDSAFENDVAAFLTLPFGVTGGAANLLVSSEWQQDGLPVVSWTYNGDAMTIDEDVEDPGNAGNNARISHLVNPDSGTHDLTYTKSSAVGGITLCVAEYSGCKQTDQPNATSTADGVAVSGLSYTVTTTVDDCWIMTVLANGAGGAVTGTSNYTTLEAPSTTNGQLGDSDGSVGAAGGKTVSMTGGTARWYSASAAYAPSVAAGPAGVKTVNGTAVASVKTKNGTAWASVKTLNGTA